MLINIIISNFAAFVFVYQANFASWEGLVFLVLALP